MFKWWVTVRSPYFARLCNVEQIAPLWMLRISVQRTFCIEEKEEVRCLVPPGESVTVNTDSCKSNIHPEMLASGITDRLAA